MSSFYNAPRVLVAIFAASVLLAAGVGTSAAGRLSFSNQNIRATWRSIEYQAAIVTIRCPLTLEGSFHTRTIAKSERTLIGAITRGTINNERCTNGTAEVANLPWHLTYESFAGTLPNITAVNPLISRFRFLITIPGFCSRGAYGTETDNITGRAIREGGGALTGIEPVEGRNSMSIVAARELCPSSGALRNRAEDVGVITLLGATTRITVTLI